VWWRGHLCGLAALRSQGLKPLFQETLYGTTEVVPFHEASGALQNAVADLLLAEALTVSEETAEVVPFHEESGAPADSAEAEYLQELVK